MGTETKIQWTDHTWNPWRGCWKISEGCANCYADSQSRRNPAVLGEWGKGARRVEGSADYWRKPLAWNRAAEKAGKRRRVFCMSLGDIFEDRGDLDPLRVQVWETIHATPWLDWQLLTKRPAVAVDCARSMGWPGNAWLGFSAESQPRFDERWAIARGLSTFDLDRSRADAGAARFKRNQGFVAAPLHYAYLLVRDRELPSFHPSNPRTAALRRTWSRLPAPVCEALSGALARYLP